MLGRECTNRLSKTGTELPDKRLNLLSKSNPAMALCNTTRRVSYSGYLGQPETETCQNQVTPSMRAAFWRWATEYRFRYLQPVGPTMWRYPNSQHVSLKIFESWQGAVFIDGLDRSGVDALVDQPSWTGIAVCIV